MEIRGLQKTTLLDFPRKVACTVFTGGCNLRCPFCHNAGLLRAAGEGEGVSEEEFFRFLEKRRGILDGVCVTGGEPILQKDLPAFLSRIKEMGYLVKLDTNGTDPDRLSSLIEAGLLDYVAMDIKNSPQKYAVTAGVTSAVLEPVRRSVSLLLEGRVTYEFRTTLVAGYHTVEDMEAIGAWIAGAKQYFLQQFVDSGDVLTDGLSALSREESEPLLAAVRRYVPAVALRGIY